MKRQIDEAIEIYSSDLKKVVLDESKIYAFNMELNKFIHLTGGNKERDALGVGYLGYEDKNSLVEKAFAIHDITNDIQNYSKYTNIYDASPQKRTNTNLSNYNFSESKIRENVRGNRNI